MLGKLFLSVLAVVQTQSVYAISPDASSETAGLLQRVAPVSLLEASEEVKAAIIPAPKQDVELLVAPVSLLVALHSWFNASSETGDPYVAPGRKAKQQSNLLQNKTLSHAPPPLSDPALSRSLHLGKFLAVVVLGSFYGFVYGLTGAGGSIVLKPLLYFGFGVAPFKRAVFGGFFVLSILSGYGAYLGARKGNVIWRDVALCAILVCGAGCMLGSYCASVVSDKVQMLCFACVVLGSSAYTLHKSQRSSTFPAPAVAKGDAKTMTWGQRVTTAVLACTIGCICGFVGAGGGFMLVPLLMSIGHDMTTAVPTSQGVVCLSATCGFFYYGFFNEYGKSDLDMRLLLGLLSVALLGLYLSDFIAGILSQKTRQQLFAGVLLFIGCFTVASNKFVHDAKIDLPRVFLH